MRDDICREASRLIQRVMEGYISGDPKTIGALLAYFSPDVLVIGTGRHEFYTSLEALARGLEKDQEEARGIRFVVQYFPVLAYSASAISSSLFRRSIASISTSAWLSRL